MSIVSILCWTETWAVWVWADYFTPKLERSSLWHCWTSQHTTHLWVHQTKSPDRCLMNWGASRSWSTCKYRYPEHTRAQEKFHYKGIRLVHQSEMQSFMLTQPIIYFNWSPDFLGSFSLGILTDNWFPVWTSAAISVSISSTQTSLLFCWSSQISLICTLILDHSFENN